MLQNDLIVDLFSHIQDVEVDVLRLSNESLMKISNYIEVNKLEISEDISTALQYQDIISQQLSATLEAIESAKRVLADYNSTEILSQEKRNELENMLSAIVENAKEKKSRFSGKNASEHSEDEIEFF